MNHQLKIIKATFLIFLISLFWKFEGSAQNADSLLQENFYDFYSFPERFKDYNFKRDSILGETYFYDILKQSYISIPRTGSLGSAHFDFFNRPGNNKTFNDGFSQFDGYYIDPFREKTTSSQRRYSNLNYHLGSKKEQHLFVRHEQKIRPWMIAGLDLGALTSESDYTRSLNNNRNFDVYFQYESPSKVYRGYVSYTANRALNEENGGISNDSIFENASSLNTRTLPINLPQAEIKHRLRDYVLKQELNLSRLLKEKDTTALYKRFKSGSLVLSHDLWWNRKSVLFTSINADSSFFENAYFDTVTTYDSSFYNDLYQEAMLEYTFGFGQNQISIGAGYSYQDVSYDTGPAEKDYHSGDALFTAGYDSRKLKTALSVSKPVIGDARDAYRSRLLVEYAALSKKLSFYLEGGAARLAQEIRQQFYYSNHFIWNNNFEDRFEYNIAFGARIIKPDIGVRFSSRTTKNLVFYREDYLPQAYNDYISVSEITLLHAFKYGKFGIDDRIAFSFTGNDQVAPVPLWKIFASLYYENRFFKQVLGFKAGFDVNAYAKYYGYGYMPATGVFYVQHEKQIGNYPEIGAFVTLRIKQAARLFIRLDHLNAGISKREYYGAYHYPLPGRTFKFGVSWDLID